MSPSLRDASVEIQDVSFRYDDEKEALRHVFMHIDSGEPWHWWTFYGGKTMLANLISRFFDVKSGRILLGGIDVRNIPKEQLMNTVSFVFQDSRLIKTSIMKMCASCQARCFKGRSVAGVEAAQCMDIIESFPMGSTR